MNEPAIKSLSTAQLMKIFGLGRNTLRLYEEMGLLTGMTRTESGYREYSNRHLEDLKFIVEAKKVGFSLNEVKSLLEVIRDKKKITCGAVSAELAEKIKDIDEQLQILQSKKVFLGEFLGTCRVNDRDSSCDLMNAGFSKNACC